MIKATVEITKVNRYQREDQDGLMQTYAECWFKEMGNIDANYANRGLFRLAGRDADNATVGDRGEIELRIERKEIPTRSGGSFFKTEVKCCNWNCTMPRPID